MSNEIKEFKEYIGNFIEKPNNAFNNLPVCPFAHNAKINFIVTETITEEEIIALFENHIKNNQELLIVLIKSFSQQDLVNLESQILDKVSGCGWLIFSGHPLDEFQVSGVYTRRDPYPNLQFIEKQKVLDGRAILTKSYYDKWSEENLKEIFK
jgi:hypothetical protein